jgi:hypothetical protein
MKQKISSKLIAGATLVALSLALTACDPPMPPDVAAQVLEQNFTCVEGTSQISYPIGLLPIVPDLNDSLAAACVDPLPIMSQTITKDQTKANIVISSYAVTATCKPLLSVPYAMEAADLAFQVADTSTLSLSPATVAAIFSGSITNWNDPKISADNQGTELPDLAIKVRGTADALALDSFIGWFKTLKQDLGSIKVKAVADAKFTPLTEGEVAILPHSEVVAESLYSSGILLGTNKETSEQIIAIPDAQGIASAGTQLKPVKNGNNLNIKLDPTIKPVAQAGLDEVSTPYQAIYPVQLTICGEESKVNRANALFLLRLDSQGVLGSSNYNQIPEQIRYAALAIVRKGLPTPSALPKDQ